MMTKEYDARIDVKRRLTLRGAQYDHYHVKEYDDGHIELEPRELVKPFEVSERTLAIMDKSIGNLKKGKAGNAIDFKAIKKQKK